MEELSLRGGDGEFMASGTLPLLEPGNAELRWTAKALRLLGRPDMRLVVSGEGKAGEKRRVALQGRCASTKVHERSCAAATLDGGHGIVAAKGEETPHERAVLRWISTLVTGRALKVRAEGSTA